MKLSYKTARSLPYIFIWTIVLGCSAIGLATGHLLLLFGLQTIALLSFMFGLWTWSKFEEALDRKYDRGDDDYEDDES